MLASSLVHVLSTRNLEGVAPTGASCGELQMLMTTIFLEGGMTHAVLINNSRKI